jgi:probable HAF family extracellular repeat protein
MRVARLPGELLFALACLMGAPARAQFTQQGSKLVAIDATGAAEQGYSVAVSSDGNTAIVGGSADNGGVGAAWIYTRTNGTWSQQGLKLVGSNAVGNAGQGNSVAISGDGTTAIVGGFFDNTDAGAAWVFTRSNGTWTQQGSKLFGTGAKGAAEQGTSVALSNDGNTAVVSGWVDNSNTGALWVFTRSNGTWTQQGSKLVGTGATGSAYQGHSVSLSQDGNTALVGGYLDNSNAGAAWVFVRNGTAWSQQGSKLVGTGATGNAQQGFAVALSGDGNTAVVGGNSDASNIGAVWIYTRSGTTWSQQGSKLVGSGDTPTIGVQEGYSVGISSDGNTAAFGGTADNFDAGAAWVFARSGGVWKQEGAKLVGTGAVGTLVTQGRSVAMSGDSSTLLVGGIYDNSQTGAVWVFTQPLPGPGDVNHDGVVDVLDVQTMIDEALGMGAPNDDLNGDRIVNGVDVQIDIDAALNSISPASLPARTRLLVARAAPAVGGKMRAVSKPEHVAETGDSRCTIRHAVLWDRRRTTVSDVLGGELRAMNDLGQAVGSVEAECGQTTHGFEERGSGLIDLGTLGGGSSEASAINNAGQVVGASQTAGRGPLHAFLWDDGVMTDLDAGGAIASVAEGINSLGQIVGWAMMDDGQRHAVLWSAGTMVDLNAVATTAPASTVLEDATGIDDRGEITVNASDGRTYSISLLHD